MSEVSWHDAPADATLWGVYGPECFPTFFACRLSDHPSHGRLIWGFSVHEGDVGFRTLGRGCDWAEEHHLRLFLTRSAAFAHIASKFPSPPAIQDPEGALETISQALREVAHAQRSGSAWYTKGHGGLYQQVDMWAKRGFEAVETLRRVLPLASRLG